MTDTNINGSGMPGQTETNPADPVNNPGQSTNGGQDWESMAKEAIEKKSELEKVLGSQGNELGEYRDYISSLKPLLDELQNNPDLVDAIMDNKLSEEMVKAIIDGKVEIKDATQATQQVAAAQKAVIKDLGKEAKNVDPAEIERLVAEKVGLIKKEVLEEVQERDSDKEFEQKTMSFIEKTEDFEKYAEDVVKFLSEHPDQIDISVAYHAVKGQKASSESAVEEDRRRAEEAKRLALNAAGGGGTFIDAKTNQAAVDQLIAGGNRSRFI